MELNEEEEQIGVASEVQSKNQEEQVAVVTGAQFEYRRSCTNF